MKLKISILNIIFSAIPFILGCVILLMYNDFISNITDRLLDKEPPSITLNSAPKFIGRSLQKIELNVNDNTTGIGEIIANRLSYPENEQIFYFKNKSLKAKNNDISIKFPKEISENLNEGKATIEIIATDLSIYRNNNKMNLDFIVDLNEPQISLLSKFHNGIHGGTTLVIFKASDNLTKTNNFLDNGFHLFQASEMELLDEGFNDLSNYYFSFVPLQKKYSYFLKTKNKFSSSLKINAQDEALNTKELTVPFSIRPSYKGNSTHTIISPFKNEEDISSHFREKEKSIEKLFSKVNSKKLFSGSFIQPVNSKFISFGDKINWLYNNNLIFQNSSPEYCYFVSNGTPIKASQEGKVIFSDSLEGYGNVIILDHGVGISTIYYDVEQFSVNNNEYVKTGQIIGKSGVDRIQKKNMFCFQVRVNGVPVNPLEWWDPKWIQEHINNKISSAKTDTIGNIN